MQVNCISQQPYKGENQIKLEEASTKNGYSSQEWLTFVQARQLNRIIKVGSHGVRLIKVSESENDKGLKIRKVKGFTVFNLDQTEVNN